ncbi:immunity 49 family protein [Spirillospora sp. NPDC052242]
MLEVARHHVGEERIAQALEDVHHQAIALHTRLLWDLSLDNLRDACDRLLDHVAARSLAEPDLSSVEAHRALRTAAACVAGIMDLGLWPRGDFEVVFHLLPDLDPEEELNQNNIVFSIHDTRAVPPVSTWIETFALCLIGSEFQHPWRYHLVLKSAISPELREEHRDAAAALAEMDALCDYIIGTIPPIGRPEPKERVRKPDADERARAARRLDDAGPLTPDQRLLRVLLDDDRPAFERALADRLVEHRESVGADPAPRTLLPLTAFALAKLAVLAHGWHLDVRSGYLPEGLLY